jgi:hypothetical protein
MRLASDAEHKCRRITQQEAVANVEAVAVHSFDDYEKLKLLMMLNGTAG